MKSTGIALLMTGPAGSGKSTTSRHLAIELGTCVDIDIEHINFMIVDGFYPKTSEEGVDVTFTKWATSGDVIGLLAKHFLAKGYSVIIHGHVTGELLENIQKHVVLDFKLLLLPDIETVVSRDKERGEHLTMGENMVREHFNHFLKNKFEGFIRINSTAESVAQTVTKIKNTLNIS